MEVVNQVMPNREQMAGFMAPDDGEAIFMVNLLKYKEKAEYDDGRETELTGREAYHLYTEGVVKCLAKVGGGITFNGRVRRLALGAVEDLWDDIAIAMYPSRTAMLEMLQLPEMQIIGEHRAAGLAGQLNIETVGMDSFGSI
ncbi:MAG: hypothetical protein ACI9JM_001913 [Halioglobus sp.]|jgi:hypothetical protein